MVWILFVSFHLVRLSSGQFSPFYFCLVGLKLQEVLRSGSVKSDYLIQFNFHNSELNKWVEYIFTYFFSDEYNSISTFFLLIIVCHLSLF